MALRRRPTPNQNYTTEPSISTKMAWAICEAVYEATPDQKAGGRASRCICRQRGGNVACDAMLRAVSNASQVAIEHAQKQQS